MIAGYKGIGRALFIFNTILFIGIIAASANAETGELIEKNLSFQRELLYLSEIPTVITAALKEQPITEAPSAITIITAEDIRQSGVTSIPDILRIVPGIEVMSITASNTNVNVRGFNQLMSNKMLVMVDGRSVYLDFYGIVRWDSVAVPLEEIQRIEVIRGPGSALYGANAFSGVINIITKTPAQLEGAKVYFTGGGNGTGRSSFIQAGVGDKASYKFSVSGDRRNQWKDKDEKSGEFGKINGSLEYKVNNKSKLILSGGFNHFHADIYPNDLVDIIDTEGPIAYLDFLYQSSHLMIRYFWNHSDFNIQGLPYLPESDMINNVHDLKFQHSLDMGKKHSLIWGGDLRFKSIDWDEMLYDEQDEEHYAFYLQDEYKPSDNMILLFGGRYDHHPLSGGNFSPRGSILYSPVKNHTFRFSVGTAYRTPTFLDSYGLFYLYPRPLTLPFGIPFSPPLEVNNNRDLDPENIITFELSYRTQICERINSRCDFFYNEIDSLIMPEVKGPYLSLTSPHIYWQGGYINGGDAKAWGGEVSFDFLITSWLTGTINYSYQEIIDKNTDRRIRSAPKHKINGGLRANLPQGLFANLLLHYVSETTWDLLGIIPEREKVDSYSLVNARAGKMLMDNKLEIALAVFNLLHDKHKEHPLGAEIGSRVTLSLSYKF